jgi:hypothetical protein
MGDADVLNSSLKIEQLVAFSYGHARVGSYLVGAAAQLIPMLERQSQAHVQILDEAIRNLGAHPSSPPTGVKSADRELSALDVSTRVSGVRNQKQAIALLLELEDLAQGSYYVAIRKLSDPGLVRTAAQIMGNDAQHVALLRLAQKPRDPAHAVPNAFVEGKH